MDLDFRALVGFGKFFISPYKNDSGNFSFRPYKTHTGERRMPAPTLRLKMNVQRVTSDCDANGVKTSESVTLAAVYGQDGTANAQWSKWTPAGALTMSISNPDAFGRVLPEQFYFVDLVPTTREAME